CHLGNSAIAIRHIFAVVFSEFFRRVHEQEMEYSEYNNLMDITTMKPAGLDEMRTFLNARPKRIFEQLKSVFSDDVKISRELDIE
ncbi:hypothetical protein AAER45_09020, partial [Acinetobacter baumannii]|uniref:hypothetical protein n=1 Tax=Acinetobacter baumannii TaxID=470 RepID=UPI0031F3C935